MSNTALPIELATIGQTEINLLATEMPLANQQADSKQVVAIQGMVALLGAKTMDAVLQSKTTPTVQDIYFSDEVNRLINEAAANRAAAAEKQAAQFKAMGITWPINPNYKDKMNPYDVPLNYDSLMSKIRLYLTALQANPRDTNLMTSFILFMANVEKSVPKELMAKIRPELNRIANITGGQPKKSFAQMMVSYLRESFFYQQGGGADACKQGMAALLAFLGPLSGKGNPLMDQLFGWAKTYNNNVQDFIDGHTGKDGKPDLTPELFWWKAQGEAGKFFKTNCSIGGVAKQMLLDMIDELMKKFKRNQNLLIQVMMNTFGGHMDTKLQGLGAYGDLSKDLSGFTKIISDISSKFQDDKMDAAKAKAAFDELRKFMAQTDFQDMFYGNIPTSIHKLYDDLCKIKLVDANGNQMKDEKGNPRTIGTELAKGTPDWDAIARSFTKIMPNDKSPTPNPEYNQIMGDLQSLDKSATSQTSIIQTAQGIDQQQVNTCKSAWEDCSKKLMDFIHAIVQNYQRASS